MKPIPFSQLLHAFFHDWLVQQRNVSHHTVLSYRDSWRLFLRFVAAEKKKSVAKLGLADLNAAEVLAFLEDIEQVRKSSIGTRNCRLGALHSFFSFVADREPLASAQCAAVLRIPTKQAPKHEVRDLDEDEITAITAILAQPDRSKIEGQRDHVLLAVLFNNHPGRSGECLLIASPPISGFIILGRLATSTLRHEAESGSLALRLAGLLPRFPPVGLLRLAPVPLHARLSNLHGEFLSIHKISQA